MTKPTATARLANSDEPCTVCGVVPMGKNAGHGCVGCDLYAYINKRLRARFGEIIMKRGRRARSSKKFREELARAAEEIGHEAWEKWTGG